MEDIPSVKILEGIRPGNAGTGAERLEYVVLSQSVAEYAATHAERSHAFWSSEEGSVEELSKAHQLAAEFLLRTSLRATDSNDVNSELRAERFTDSSIELYGEPDASEIIPMMLDDFAFFQTHLHNRNVDRLNLNKLLNSYWGILKMSVTQEQIDNSGEKKTSISEATKKYGELLALKYDYLFDLVDESEIESYGPNELLDIFSTSLELLSEKDDESWKEWTVELKEGTNTSVTAIKKRINVASSRALATKKDVKGLLAHEILTHALRAKNGYNIDDKKLATGLPQYIDAEEGLGILSEFAVTGEFPERARDRYIDIALALGTVNGKSLNRQTLFEISFSRAQLMNELSSEPVDLNQLKKSTWTHVDRIYRGGRGDTSTTNQAVFTKDIAYYDGYKKMRDYIDASYADGKTIEEIFDYLTLGKFDPTNPVHIKYLNQAIAN